MRLIGHVRVACVLCLGGLLTACGGGGGGSDGGTGPATDSTGTGSSPGSQRVARLRYDFDANGTAEGLLTVAYDAAGRLSSETYTYTDDGTPDATLPGFSIGAGTLPFTSTYRYDASGRLQELVVVEDGGSPTTTTYTRDADGRVTQLEIASTGSGVPYSLVYGVTNTGGVPTEALIQMRSTGITQDIQRIAWAYGADGRVASETATNVVVGQVFTTAFTWGAEGWVGTITRSLGALVGETITWEHDASGRPTSRLSTADSSRYRWRWDHTALTWTIDLGDDGSTEAIVHTELEAGPCQPTVMWHPGAEPNAAASDTLPIVPGAGYSVVPFCAGA